MTDRNKQLCRDLMHAETENEIVSLLKAAGYWHDDRVWRNLGDAENNFSTVGNQQGDPVAALVEKIVNSIDALLLGECRSRGIDPEGQDAPKTPPHAVAQFFEERDPEQFNPAQDGQIAFWDNERVRNVARQLTITATGDKPPGSPSLSIADAGEGQTPDSFHGTFLSLGKSNKLRIPFVQGKFNMGGTGALQFCGTTQNFQLIVSKRRPCLLDAHAPVRDQRWGFTILRRVDPVSTQRSSVFQYLAPNGDILAFGSDTFGIFPDENQGDPYGRVSEFGTLVKLYRYEFSGQSSITGTRGLFSKVDSALPRAILPARYFDARYERKGGGFESRRNGFGVEALLLRQREELLESGFPHEEQISVQGMQIGVRIYAFRSPADKSTTGDRLADSYRARSNAVAFLINGQTHATQDTRFFSSGRVNLDYLRQDLFVTVDCTPLPGRQREDLFMNSRDRMRGIPLRRDLIAELEKLLKNHPALRHLNTKRRDASRQHVDSTKGVHALVVKILQDYPDLQNALNPGYTIRPVGPTPPPPPPFSGKEFPTYFDLIQPKASGSRAYMSVAQSSPLRLIFDTDAEDGYFSRLNDPGTLLIYGMNSDFVLTQRFSRTGPISGRCTLSASDLLADYSIGDVVDLRVKISDVNPDFRPPFIHEVSVLIKEKVSPPTRPSPPSKPKLDVPLITKVWRHQWPDLHDPPDFVFDYQTAAQVKRNLSEEGSSTFDIYINMDNTHLERARRRVKQPGDQKPLDERWCKVLHLFVLGLLSDHSRALSSDEDRDWYGDSPDRFVYYATRAIAPLIPVLDEICTQ